MTTIKKTKKMSPKDMAKAKIMALFLETLNAADIYFENGADFGMTKDTIVAHLEACDVQIKLITPKSGIDRYAVIECTEEE